MFLALHVQCALQVSVIKETDPHYLCSCLIVFCWVFLSEIVELLLQMLTQPVQNVIEMGFPQKVKVLQGLAGNGGGGAEDQVSFSVGEHQRIWCF